ncbi:efflux RND transporter periplasmic adaptor subunit [Kineobactrum salinum]|uniref:Efflux RND transporter periplasmic adaptor subunit n=1 Tax=Kineobactrum salinum TaxID=2708301 RepID=A0A6C0TZ09_9GAMM|nr:efflux RND transporter periplasmic adaptor subunit [Kineobactrum salinum]QIB64888.1 efflux RND transporter periplasmic adaptor subunit [Kineobactrum salinum]
MNLDIGKIPDQAPRLLRSRARVLFLITVGLLGYAAAGYSQAPPGVEAIRVVESPLIESVPLTGSVVAGRHSRLSTEVSGLIRQLAVDVGDSVEAGAVLVELDDELVRIDRDQAQANLLRVRAQWQDSERRLREAQSLRDGAIAESEVRALEAQERIQRAALGVAQANLQWLEAEVVRHRIHAPYDGVISARNMDVGQWVAPGEDLMGLVATHPLWIDFQVPQRYFSRVSESARVQLRFDPHFEQVFTGSIHRKVPLSEIGARTFLIRISPPHNIPALIPGMATSGLLQLGMERSGVQVPRDALIRYPDGRVTVWRVSGASEAGSTGTATEVRVDPGISNNGWLEIKSGLSAGT